MGGVAALAPSGRASKFRTYSGPEVTGIVVRRAERRLHLLRGDRALRSFDIELGGDPVGPKRFQGDRRAPEGEYRIDRRNPSSDDHLSIGLSYPNAADRAYAPSMGRGPDRTAGCIAVSNREMEDVDAMVRDGTPILPVP